MTDPTFRAGHHITAGYGADAIGGMNQKDDQ